MRVTIITFVHEKTPRDLPRVFVGYGRDDAKRAACTGFAFVEFDPGWMRVQHYLKEDDVSAAFTALCARMNRHSVHVQDIEVVG